MSDTALVPVAILIKRHHPQKNLWKCKSLSGTSLEWLKDHFQLSGFKGDECLVEFPDEIEIEKGKLLYVDRFEFPKIPTHEIYLCDVLGREVWVEGRTTPSYRIVGYFENSLTPAASSVSLTLESLTGGKEIEIPSVAFRFSEKPDEKCFLNDAEMWESLDLAPSTIDDVD